MDQETPITPLKRLRIARGVTLDEIAKVIKRNNGTISRIERAESQASPDTAALIVAFFNGAITELEILYPERYMDRRAADGKSAPRAA